MPPSSAMPRWPGQAPLCYGDSWQSSGILPARASGVEQEVQHVAILDDIRLSFGAHLARFLGGLFAAQRCEIVIGNGLGADETALEITVDNACGLGRRGARADGPG